MPRPIPNREVPIPPSATSVPRCSRRLSRRQSVMSSMAHLRSGLVRPPLRVREKGEDRLRRSARHRVVALAALLPRPQADKSNWRVRTNLPDRSSPRNDNPHQSSALWNDKGPGGQPIPVNQGLSTKNHQPILVDRAAGEPIFLTASMVPHRGPTPRRRLDHDRARARSECAR